MGEPDVALDATGKATSKEAQDPPSKTPDPAVKAPWSVEQG